MGKKHGTGKLKEGEALTLFTNKSTNAECSYPKSELLWFRLRLMIPLKLPLLLLLQTITKNASYASKIFSFDTQMLKIVVRQETPACDR